jgi:hypothetical protein
MSEDRKELVAIDWRRSLAFLEIVRSFRMAINPVSLMLCFVGLAASIGLAVGLDQVPGLGHTNIHSDSFWNNVKHVGAEPLWGDWSIPFVKGGTFERFMAFASVPLTTAYRFVDLIVEYWQKAPWFALVNTILGLALWGVIGGAVTRIAAVRMAREESVPWKSAIRFACSKWLSLVASPLVPFGVWMALVVILLAAPGALMMIPYFGEVAGGILFGLALVFGLVLSLIMIGGLFSVGLQWPTIAAEGSDAFDAISRSVSYISSRPWRYMFYTLFSAVYGCLTFIFVKFLTFLTLWTTHWGVSLFHVKGQDVEGKLDRLWTTPTFWSGPWPDGGSQFLHLESTASLLFAIWVWVVVGMMIAFLVSFFFSSQTVVYFLLRREVDATDIEEVYMEESDEEELPVAGGQTGAPEAAKPPESGTATTSEAGPAATK